MFAFFWPAACWVKWARIYFMYAQTHWNCVIYTPALTQSDTFCALVRICRPRAFVSIGGASLRLKLKAQQVFYAWKRAVCSVSLTKQSKAKTTKCRPNTKSRLRVSWSLKQTVRPLSRTVRAAPVDTQLTRIRIYLDGHTSELTRWMQIFKCVKHARSLMNLSASVQEQ